MAAIKGQHLRIFIGGVAVAAAQECTLHVQMEVEQQSTKDDDDNANRNNPTSLIWDLQTRGVVTTDPDRNDADSLLDRIGQTVRVEFAMAGGEKNSVKGTVMIAGEAIISDVQLTAQNKQNSTYQVALTGIRNALTDIRDLITSNGSGLITADGHQLAAPHERDE